MSTSSLNAGTTKLTITSDIPGAHILIPTGVCLKYGRIYPLVVAVTGSTVCDGVSEDIDRRALLQPVEQTVGEVETLVTRDVKYIVSDTVRRFEAWGFS